MRIAQFSESFYPIVDGVGRVVYNYANCLGSRGHECYVVAPMVNTGYRGGWPFELVDYTGVPVPGATQYRSGVAGLDRHYIERMDKIELDIVHAHTPFFCGQEALRIGAKQNIPIVGTFHSKYYDDFYKATHRELLANIGVKFVVDFFDKCDEVWAVSESSAVVLREYGFEGDIVVMQNGTQLRPIKEEDKLAAAEKFNIDLNHPVFLFVGQLNWKKGILRLLEAAAYLKNKGERFTLVLAGQGPDKDEIIKKAEEWGIDGFIKLTGHIAEQNLLDGLYQCATLFTFPSLYDTFSLVLREAAAMGTPGVVAEGGAAAEPIVHGKNGLISPDDGEKLGSLLLSYMHDESAIKSMGQAAYETIPIKWDDVMDNVCKRYEALADLRGSDKMNFRHKRVLEKLSERMDKLLSLNMYETRRF